MFRFWQSVIRPICDSIHAKHIVEVGAWRGEHTSLLLEYAKNVDGTVHVIDPEPAFPVHDWQQQWGSTMQLYESLSVNVLPKIPRWNIVLIDGDHNWYTVLHELRILERRVRDGMPFPVVLLHDTEWPYARRDMYHNPEVIPVAYRHPYIQKGLHPDRSELCDNGINNHVLNSIHEHPVQSGVRTAVEDFLYETNVDVRAMYIPGLSGLGILIPKYIEDAHPNLTAFLASLHVPAPIKDILQTVEKERFMHEYELGLLRHEMCTLDVLYKKTREQLTIDSQNRREDQRVAEEYEKQYAALEQRVTILQEEKTKLTEQYSLLIAEHTQLKQDQYAMTQATIALRHTITTLEQGARAQDMALAELQTKNRVLQEKLDTEVMQRGQSSAEITTLRAEQANLVHNIRQKDQAIQTLEQTRARIYGELQHIQHTRSWRWTWALRELDYIRAQARHTSTLQTCIGVLGVFWKIIGSPMPVLARKIRYEWIGKPGVQTRPTAKVVAKKNTLAVQSTREIYAYFSHSLELSGAPVYLEALAKHHADIGKDCVFFSPVSGHIRERICQFGTCEILPAMSPGSTFNAQKVALALQKYEPSVCFVNTILNHQLIAVIRATLPRTKIIWIIHESNIGDYANMLPSFSKEDFTKADSIVFPCNSTKEIYSAYTTDAACTIYNGTDIAAIDTYRHSHTKADIRRKHGIPMDATVIVQIGTLMPRKGTLESGTAAVQYLQTSGRKDVYFVFVGSDGIGADYIRPQLRQMAVDHGLADRILDFPATLDPYSFYMMADVLLCNSHFEAFPIVILEAMAFGLPIIAPSIYGIPEQITHNQEGILIAPNDANLHKIIADLIINTELRTTLGKNARTKVETQFSSTQWHFAIDRLITFGSPKALVAQTNTNNVAVIIPCRNYGMYLSAAIESVLQQSMRPTRVIVVDDGSTDTTAEICLAYANHGIEYKRGEWHNVSHARNAAVQGVTEEFLVFLDADDMLAPNYIEECVRAMSTPSIGFTYGDWSWFGDTERYDRSPDFNPTIFKKLNHIPSHMMMRRSAFEHAGGYKAAAIHEDWDIIRRFIDLGWKGRRADTFVYKRQHSTNRYDTTIAVQAPSHAENIHLYNNAITVYSLLYGDIAIRDTLPATINAIENIVREVYSVWVDIRQDNSKRQWTKNVTPSVTTTSMLYKEYVHICEDTFVTDIYKRGGNPDCIAFVQSLLSECTTEYVLFIPPDMPIELSDIQALFSQLQQSDTVLFHPSYGSDGDPIFRRLCLLNLDQTRRIFANVEYIGYSDIQRELQTKSIVRTITN